MTNKLITFAVVDRPAGNAVQDVLSNQVDIRRRRPHQYDPEDII